MGSPLRYKTLIGSFNNLLPLLVFLTDYHRKKKKELKFWPLDKHGLINGKRTARL